MQTMLNGAAILDCALLVVAGGTVELQTNEHLVAAEVLGITRFAVVQNKCDLLVKELDKGRQAAAARRAALTLLCIRKYGSNKTLSQLHTDVVRVMAKMVFATRYGPGWEAFGIPGFADIKRAVTGTAAEEAPVIPVSVVKKINLQQVLAAIVAMTAPSSSSSAAPKKSNSFAASILGVVRSFDINRPGTEIEQMVGGIVGGSVMCGVFRVGDRVTLMPQNVHTRVVGIKSENDQLTEARRGGLVALELGIDPCLALRNKLVGQLVTSAPLPVASGSCVLRIRLLKGAELKSGDSVTVSRLACVVAATVTARDKTTAQITLASPLPLDEADSNVCIAKGGKLLGVGVFRSGLELPPLPEFDPSQGKKKKPTKKANEKTESVESLAPLPSYAQMLRVFATMERAHIRAKVVVPPPVCSKTKTRLFVSNFGAICSALRRPPPHVMAFVMEELFLEGFINRDECLVLKGILGVNGAKKFESTLLRYASIWLRCEACANYATELQHISSHKFVIHCPSCYHSRRQNLKV